MKPNPIHEIADRDAEERSEDDGMPEHAAKAHDPARWTADRGTRVRQRLPERSPGGAGLSGVALVSCAVAAALASARGALRWMRHRGAAARLPR
jgi:hypothetical protein